MLTCPDHPTVGNIGFQIRFKSIHAVFSHFGRENTPNGKVPHCQVDSSNLKSQIRRRPPYEVWWEAVPTCLQSLLTVRKVDSNRLISFFQVLHKNGVKGPFIFWTGVNFSRFERSQIGTIAVSTHIASSGNFVEREVTRRLNRFRDWHIVWKH